MVALIFTSAVVPIIANNKVYTYSLNVEVQARQTMIQAGT